MRDSLIEYTFGWYLVYQYRLSKIFLQTGLEKDYCEGTELIIALVM